MLAGEILLAAYAAAFAHSFRHRLKWLVFFQGACSTAQYSEDYCIDEIALGTESFDGYRVIAKPPAGSGIVQRFLASATLSFSIFSLAMLNEMPDYCRDIIVVSFVVPSLGASYLTY
jgi:hypothetical protein